MVDTAGLLRTIRRRKILQISTAAVILYGRPISSQISADTIRLDKSTTYCPVPTFSERENRPSFLLKFRKKVLTGGNGLSWF